MPSFHPGAGRHFLFRVAVAELFVRHDDMSTWEASLVKRCLSEWLIDECLSSVPQAEQGRWRAELSPRVSAPSDLKKLRKAVADLKRLVPTEQGESLSDELREIVDDARWAKTQRGKYVLEVNQWLQPFHAEFRAKRAFLNVMIGGHADRTTLAGSWTRRRLTSS